MSRFKDRSFTVEHKSDGTPVTEVDREVEELLRAQLSRYAHATVLSVKS